MFNWIGELPDRDRLLRLAGLHWHEYGKRPRPGRKLGHATVTAPDAASLVDRCWQLVEMLGGPWPDRLSRFQASRPWPGP
jgi:5-(carboxyamino)imidazole ribonucleotide synthase